MIKLRDRLAIIFTGLWIFFLFQSNFIAHQPYLFKTEDTITVKRFLKKQNITIFQEYGDWLLNNIKYISDTAFLYTWATPEETLSRGYGDCEDFAFLSKKVLKYLGYKPIVLGMLSTKIGHAICIFPYQGTWIIFDNNTWTDTKLSNDRELFLFLQKTYNFILIKELNYE